MFEKMNYAFILILIGLIALISAPGSSVAQEQVSSDQAAHLIAQAAPEGRTPESAPKSPEGWISNGKSLGMWWKKRARHYDPMPSALLYHIVASYSYDKSTGNIEDEQHKVRGTLTLRKNIFNSTTSYTFKDKDYGGTRKPKKKQTFDEFMFAEVWKKVDIAAAYQWYRYNKRYIENRHIFSGGLYFTLADSPKLTLKAGVYYGYMITSYMNDDIKTDMMSYGLPEESIKYYDDYSADVIHLLQRLNWSITEKITFTEKMGYMVDLSDSEFYHWKLNLDLNYQITKNISVFSSYEIDYDSNETEKELRGVEAKDTDLTAGIRLTF